jgi:hypothetical protein
MALLLLFSVLLLTVVLGPIYGVDSRDLARRGNRPQFPLLPDEDLQPTR